MLNSNKINEVQFDRSKNGYDQVQVDAFLDTVEQDYTEFEQKLSALTAKVKELEAGNENIKISQSSIQAVLVSAQRLADEIVEKARVDAQNIIDEANAKAKVVNDDTEARKAAADQAIKQLIADAAKKSEGMITAAHDSVARQQILFDELKQQIAKFKNDIKAKYKEHIELLSQIPDSVLGTATEAAAAVKTLIEQGEENNDEEYSDADDNNNESTDSYSADPDEFDDDADANKKANGFQVNIAFDEDDQTDNDSVSDNPDDEIGFGKSKFFRKNK